MPTINFREMLIKEGIIELRKEPTLEIEDAVKKVLTATGRKILPHVVEDISQAIQVEVDRDKIKIKKFENDTWWLIRTDGQEFHIECINQHNTDKLQKLYAEKDEAYITLEKTTYSPDEFRCKISENIPKHEWDDDNIICIVTNETGNLNPNAKRDIEHAKAVMKLLNIGDPNESS